MLAEEELALGNSQVGKGGLPPLIRKLNQHSSLVLRSVGASHPSLPVNCFVNLLCKFALLLPDLFLPLFAC